MKYAKIVNNNLIYAPKNKNGISNWINDEKAVLADGYLPVCLQTIPTGEHLVGYEIINNTIVYKTEQENKNTYEYVKNIRAELYRKNVDDLTLQIQRLRDKTQTPEIIAEIAKLVEERDLRAEEIDLENPYPEENI
jgi:ethanolamine ammonia-lyase large subunit